VPEPGQITVLKWKLSKHLVILEPDQAERVGLVAALAGWLKQTQSVLDALVEHRKMISVPEPV
jgi:hypothetical protein